MSPFFVRLCDDIDGFEICFSKYLAYVLSKRDFIEYMYVVNKLLSAVAYTVKKHTAS